MKIIYDNNPNEHENEKIVFTKDEFTNLVSLILWQGTSQRIEKDTINELGKAFGWQIWNAVIRNKEILSMKQEYENDGSVHFIKN